MEERWRCSYHPGGLWTPTQTGDRQAGRVRGGQAARTPHPLSSSPSLQVHPISETQARHMDPAAINTSRRPPPPLPRLTAAIRTKTPFLSSRLPLHLHIPPYFKSRAFIKVNSFKWISLFFFQSNRTSTISRGENCSELQILDGDVWMEIVRPIDVMHRQRQCLRLRPMNYVCSSIDNWTRVEDREAVFYVYRQCPGTGLFTRPSTANSEASSGERANYQNHHPKWLTMLCRVSEPLTLLI